MAVGIAALVIGASVLTSSWSLAAEDPVAHARRLLEEGDAVAAVSAASAFIKSSPGDVRIPDAQRLLGLAYERDGALVAAWEQYTLFLDNFPVHPAHKDVSDRRDELVRGVRERVRPLPRQWIPTSPPLTGGLSANVAVIIGVPPSGLDDRTVRHLTRAALDGMRIWVRPALGGSAHPFDPFDDAQVRRLEARFAEWALWPIEGFVIDAELFLDDQTRPGAAEAAYAELAKSLRARPGGEERLTWTWAGLRSRASARALGRFVAAVDGVNPRSAWVVRLSADAVISPERAAQRLGEDWGELRQAAPSAVWAIEGHRPFDPVTLTGDAAAARRLRFARWLDGGEIMAAIPSALPQPGRDLR